MGTVPRLFSLVAVYSVFLFLFFFFWFAKYRSVSIRYNVVTPAVDARQAALRPRWTNKGFQPISKPIFLMLTKQNTKSMQRARTHDEHRFVCVCVCVCFSLRQFPRYPCCKTVELASCGKCVPTRALWRVIVCVRVCACVCVCV